MSHLLTLPKLAKKFQRFFYYRMFYLMQKAYKKFGSTKIKVLQMQRRTDRTVI